MSNSKLPRGNPKWKKGVSGNPIGRAPLPEPLRQFKALTAEEVKAILGKFGRASYDELKAYVENKSVPALELAFASALLSAIDNADINKIEFFLNRTIGKVKDETTHTVNFEQLPTHELVKAGQRAIAFLTKAKEPAYETIEVEASSQEASAKTSEKT